MRNNNKMLHRTMPEYRHMLTGAILTVSLAGCGWDSALDGYDLGPSEYSIAQGYPSLVPASYFRIADYTVPDTNNLTARFAMLKRKVLALRGPVLTPSQRDRLEAAIERRIAAGF